MDTSRQYQCSPNLEKGTILISILHMIFSLLIATLFTAEASAHEAPGRSRAREMGIEVGVMTTGPLNAITDVPGVLVGHKTIIRGEDERTGVTAVLPHGGNIFLQKVPAAVFVGNGFGKLAGFTQIEELGNIETPIVLTNTLCVGTAVKALVSYTLAQPGNEEAYSVNAVVGETNDSYLNDIRGMHVTEKDVIEAIKAARSGPVEEGSIGAGTGTICLQFKGGIGTASRYVPGFGGTQYLLGVLVQSNFGGTLNINGAPVGRELKRKQEIKDTKDGGKGSCMIIVATDAPLSSRNLKRLAKRAVLGLARTGSFMSNGSGDYVIAFSTAYRIPYESRELLTIPPLLPNDAMSLFFRAVVEATQEAVYNSLFMAGTVKGYKGHEVEAIPLDKVTAVCKKYHVLKTH